MATQTLSGKLFYKMLTGGAMMLSEHQNEINDLNVFPVPDGDTGTNMMRTLDGGLAELSEEGEEKLSEVSSKFAHGVLLGARGNSGVILSQIFSGINEVLKEYDEVDAKALAKAFLSGVKKSYSAVQNPTEGTILTVFRESAEYASEKITENSTIEDFLRYDIDMAKKSLARTKEILPALAEADVVDSGGAGYVYIVSGMYEALAGKREGSIYKTSAHHDHAHLDLDSFTRDSVLEFGYCTEFILRLTTAKVDPDSFDVSSVLCVLNELGGESIVAYKDGDIVKVHVHTFNPGAVLAKVQEFGEFLTVKIENMSLGHSEETKVQKKKRKKCSVITVASGEGICALFSQLGADAIVAGGQTANPSTEEFIEAFEKCNADNIVVLPNNKNVFLAAKQASEIYTDSKVYIVPTKTLMQGYSALNVISPDMTDIETMISGAERAARNVVDAEITEAVRDVTINGVDIKKGDYIAISEGEITTVSDSSSDTLMKFLGSLDMDDYEIITLFVGKGVTSEERASLVETIEDEYPDCELIVYEGGQDVYDYMIAIE